MKTKETSLNNRQQQILESFIEKFLPQRGNKRKNTGNELEFVHSTIDRIFKKHFGFSLSFDDILTCFEKLNYTVFTKQGEWDWEKKDYRPSDTGGGTKLLIRGNERIDIYERTNTAFIYIDIDAFKVRDLNRTSVWLSPETNAEKVIEQQRLLQEIEVFKKAQVL